MNGLPKHIHMVGIGGIGMSALAQLLAHQGKKVSGSDREETPAVALLKRRGIPVTVGHAAENIPAGVEMLIYSDAVWPDNPERSHAAQSDIKQISYFEALGIVSRQMRTIAVAGTHGKTTTTGMLAAILKDAQENPTAIVGSIVQDFGSNFLAGKDDLLVVEACEYRDHLLELSPETLVITNIELDHTDFFPSLNAVQNTFRAAAERVPENGAIVTNPHDPNIAPILSHVRARVVDYTQESVPALSLIGEFNRANAQAAKAGARAAFPEISPAVADATLAQFKGSWRRFEFKGETAAGAFVYDDYAHHPTAIEKTIAGAREKFPDKRIVVAFHPHLYSRTKSLLNEFAQALSRADEAIVVPIYAAREAPDPSISNEVLAAAARTAGGRAQALNSFEEIRAALSKYGNDTLVVTMGAGDIYKVAEQIIQE
ncbi:MAG TPA: Mur ligase domain-containing protein [Candidatus Paceibacterota bacterium]|nr:Mur ligase domain-containing protein [Candidatus Paceibacterota bacterium]